MKAGTAMGNLLLEKAEYKIDTTARGTWRRYMYPTGRRFAEFTSHSRFLGLPVIHYTYGICPESGKRIVAKGVLAIGRFAVGFIAIGHVSAGIIACGQASAGVLLALGQAGIGFYCIGQLAIGFALGIGQIATGYTAIGQFAFGVYVLAQLGLGRHVWSMKNAAPEAVLYFKLLWGKLSGLFG
jgi:hypothetical protein